MDGSHLALKDELVISINDDGLEFGICRHQAQVAFIFSGGVECLHRQTAVDESYHNVAVIYLFLAVSQTDVAIEDSKADHLSTNTDKVGGFWVMNELFVQIQALMLVVNGR